VGFNGDELALLMKSFSLAFSGSEILYSKCSDLTLKFKYALSDSNKVTILNSFVKAKQNPPPHLIESLKTISKDSLKSIELKHTLNYLDALFKIDNNEQEQKGYVDHRSEL
jgi:hypothetical protein